MKKPFPMNKRTLTLIGVLVPLLALFVYVALRSGPLAPVPVTITTIERKAIAPALSGIGTVEARYSYKIGPTLAGRIRQVNVQVGDRVRAGQLLGEMDPVDLDARIDAQQAALKRAQANVLAAEAQVQDASARSDHAQSQARRYEQLLPARAVSEEAVALKRQDRRVTEANLSAARANRDAAQQELARVQAEHEALRQQRENLRLIAPVDGLVVARNADPGTTLVAGQAVLELIDPASLWINVRFHQLDASGLRAELPVRIVLRSRSGENIDGRVLRVEPLADAITEETLAKAVFDRLPEPLPPLGELAEVTVALPELPALPLVPIASVRRVEGQLGVWVVDEGAIRFARVQVGAADLDGRVQVLDGLKSGDRVVLYSQRALDAHSRIRIVERLPGVSS